MRQIVYNFAYGSNMLMDRLENRVGAVRKVGTYVLKNHELVFDCGAKFSYANIIPMIGENVEGVLYEMSTLQIKQLDWYEGLYEHEYFIHPDGNIVCVYVSHRQINKCFEGAKPGLDYLNMIIEGAYDNALWDTMNKLITYKEVNYKLKSNKHKKH